MASLFFTRGRRPGTLAIVVIELDACIDRIGLAYCTFSFFCGQGR